MAVLYKFKTIDQFQRCDESWYLIKVLLPEIMSWCRSQPEANCLEIHGRQDDLGYGIDGRRFAIDAKTYVLLNLRWS